ncbi:MAG: GNAT family N-acetyltransferase [Lysobacterales bacterium]
MALLIRDVCEQELPQVLALNNAAGPSVLPLDGQRLAELFDLAIYFRVAEIDGHLAGFLIALDAQAAYGSANFRWFAGRYPDFVYIDRIVVAASYRRLGLGRIFYADVQSFAEVRSPVLACEIFLEPRDDASVLFHGTYGFREVGQQRVDGRRIGLLVKELCSFPWVRSHYLQAPAGGLPAQPWLAARSTRPAACAQGIRHG